MRQESPFEASNQLPPAHGAALALLSRALADVFFSPPHGPVDVSARSLRAHVDVLIRPLRAYVDAFSPPVSATSVVFL